MAAYLRHPHADRFLAFLGDELHPLIATRWRIDTARSGFFGYSYGGLFAAWLALQKHPRFPIVYAGSPGIMVDNSKVYDVLRQQRESHSDYAGRRLHLTICELEISQPTGYQLLARNYTRLLQELGSEPLAGLKVTSRIVPHETHIMGYAGSWYSFLRSCFAASPVPGT